MELYHGGVLIHTHDSARMYLEVEASKWDDLIGFQRRWGYEMPLILSLQPLHVLSLPSEQLSVLPALSFARKSFAT